MERRDIVVIGGGIAGTSVAWRLATSASVVLVETEAQLGIHASGRSAAMTNRTSGPPAICVLADASRAFLEHPPDGFSDVALLAPRGLLWVGRTGTDELLAAALAKAPGSATRVDQSGARQLSPMLFAEPCASGGVHEQSAMSIDVDALLQGYRRSFVAVGGEIHTDAEATDIKLERSRGTWRVEAGPRVIECATVVNAAGAWGDVVAHRAGVRRLGLHPLRRTAALVDARGLEGQVVDPSSPMVMDVEGRWYALPGLAGLLISAADETPSEPTDARPEEADVALAIERVNDAFDLDIRHVRHAWSGLRTFTEDRVPAVGPDPTEPSFVWLVGQGGAGIKTSPALSEMTADAIFARKSIPPELDVARFRR